MIRQQTIELHQKYIWHGFDTRIRYPNVLITPLIKDIISKCVTYVSPCTTRAQILHTSKVQEKKTMLGIQFQYIQFVRFAFLRNQIFRKKLHFHFPHFSGKIATVCIFPIFPDFFFQFKFFHEIALY